MNKRLVMWGTFLIVFLASLVGSYKFINSNNQDMTIELGAPSLPLVSFVRGEEVFNTLHGYTGVMDIRDGAEYVWPVAEDRIITGQIETYGAKVAEVTYEVRNNDGTRLIESGDITWEEKHAGFLDFSVSMKDLIAPGEEYIFAIILSTAAHKEVGYYTRFVYGEEYDLDNQLAFVKEFHANTLTKDGAAWIAPYMETDKNRDNSTLAYVDIHSDTRQVVWDKLPVEAAGEVGYSITYLQDNYGAYTLDYYLSSTVGDTVEYYHVVENFLVSTYGDKIYLLDYERTADSIFLYEEDVYFNDKINLSIQSKEISVTESEDGNMAAFVVNGMLYYYDDIENHIYRVYGFVDDINSDERSMYFKNDIKVLHVNEFGSIYFMVYGYMNRGNYEGRTGIALYAYNGQTKLVEEIGFYEAGHSPEYVMQEVRTLAYLGRQEKLYLIAEGNLVCYDLQSRSLEVMIPFCEDGQLFISKDQSCVVSADPDSVMFWHLGNDTAREITVTGEGEIVPQGFIDNDFVYGVAWEEDMVLQSDGTYARYMQEIRIQNAQGVVKKQYRKDGELVSACRIQGNQILLDMMKVKDGRIQSSGQEQIVSGRTQKEQYNLIRTAVTDTYQTIQQVELKNKMNTSTLEHTRAKEIFYEGDREIALQPEVTADYYSARDPWGEPTYVKTAGEAMLLADEMEGYARDEAGFVIWKKAATVTKNQIMAIELENATGDRSSKAICMDIMLRQVGSPRDTQLELSEGATCQEILEAAPEDWQLMDITGSSLEAMLYYTNQDIPIMVLYEDGDALLVTGFNQFNIVVMDPVNRKLGYMSRSDASEMLAETKNQVFTYYRKDVN